MLDQYPEFSNFNNYLTQTQVSSAISSRQSITVLAVENDNLSPIDGQSTDFIKRVMSVHVILEYYDVQKLQNLSNKTAILTTLYQASGLAQGQQGFLNVTILGTTSMAFGSAVPGSTFNSNLVEVVTTQPYNISILQVSNVIVPPSTGGSSGTTNSSTNSTSPSSSPISPTSATTPKSASAPATSPPPASKAPTSSGATPPKSGSTPPTATRPPAPTTSPKSSPSPHAATTPTAPRPLGPAYTPAAHISASDTPVASPPRPLGPAPVADGPAADVPAGDSSTSGATANGGIGISLYLLVLFSTYLALAWTI